MGLKPELRGEMSSAFEDFFLGELSQLSVSL